MCVDQKTERMNLHRVCVCVCVCKKNKPEEAKTINQYQHFMVENTISL